MWVNQALYVCFLEMCHNIISCIFSTVVNLFLFSRQFHNLRLLKPNRTHQTLCDRTENHIPMLPVWNYKHRLYQLPVKPWIVAASSMVHHKLYEHAQGQYEQFHCPLFSLFPSLLCLFLLHFSNSSSKATLFFSPQLCGLNIPFQELTEIPSCFPSPLWRVNNKGPPKENSRLLAEIKQQYLCSILNFLLWPAMHSKVSSL